MKNLWIVPGAPLSNGQGWVIWCSRKGEKNFTPPEVIVQRRGTPVTVQTEWDLLPKASGLKRRIGLLTVKLSTPAPSEGAEFCLTISANNESQDFKWSTLPYEVSEKGVTFLFASCFWQNNDRDGYYRAGLKDLQALSKPQFKMLIGDQVYLD